MKRMIERVINRPSFWLVFSIVSYLLWRVLR